jgi:hypothetical protein
MTVCLPRSAHWARLPLRFAPARAHPTRSSGAAHGRHAFAVSVVSREGSEWKARRAASERAASGSEPQTRERLGPPEDLERRARPAQGGGITQEPCGCLDQRGAPRHPARFAAPRPLPHAARARHTPRAVCAGVVVAVGRTGAAWGPRPGRRGPALRRRLPDFHSTGPQRRMQASRPPRPRSVGREPSLERSEAAGERLHAYRGRRAGAAGGRPHTPSRPLAGARPLNPDALDGLTCAALRVPWGACRTSTRSG